MCADAQLYMKEGWTFYNIYISEYSNIKNIQNVLNMKLNRGKLNKNIVVRKLESSHRVPQSSFLHYTIMQVHIEQNPQNP